MESVMCLWFLMELQSKTIKLAAHYDDGNFDIDELLLLHFPVYASQCIKIHMFRNIFGLKYIF